MKRFFDVLTSGEGVDSIKKAHIPKGGTQAVWSHGEELLFVSNYPNILEEITGNNILQIYKSPDGYVSMVGLPKTECSFCENNYLDMISSSINEVLIDGLEELDRKLSLKEDISHQKVYKLYGEDKYNLKGVHNEK